MSVSEDLARTYRVAFLRYLPRQEESALSQGYELARTAVADGITVLELAQVHHDALVAVLGDTVPAQAAGVATAASEFFLEVLAAFDLTHRALLPRLMGLDGSRPDAEEGPPEE